MGSFRGFNMKKSHKIFFTISVILNLVLMGVIAGHAMKKAHEMPWFELRETLAPQTQELMKNMFEAKKDIIRSHWHTLKEKKKALSAVVTAEQFDENAFNIAMQDWQAFNTQVTEGKKGSLSTLLKQLPQEERMKLSEHVVRILIGEKERGHAGHKGDMRKRIEEWREGKKPAREEVKPDLNLGETMPESK